MNRRAAITLLFIAATAAGCSSLNDRSAPASSADSDGNTVPNVATAGKAPAATREDPVADIDAMADRFLAQRSFRATMTGSGDRQVRTDMEFVAPDRFRLKTNLSPETVIVIGKDVFRSTGDGWKKFPGALGDTVPDLRATFNEEGRQWFSDVQFVGEEVANGKPSFVYRYKNKGPGSTGENDSRIWISKADGLPVKIEANYKSGSLRTMVVEYDYDQTITIEPPKI